MTATQLHLKDPTAVSVSPSSLSLAKPFCFHLISSSEGIAHLLAHLKLNHILLTALRSLACNSVFVNSMRVRL